MQTSLAGYVIFMFKRIVMCMSPYCVPQVHCTPTWLSEHCEILRQVWSRTRWASWKGRVCVYREHPLYFIVFTPALAVRTHWDIASSMKPDRLGILKGTHFVYREHPLYFIVFTLALAVRTLRYCIKPEGWQVGHPGRDASLFTENILCTSSCLHQR